MIDQELSVTRINDSTSEFLVGEFFLRSWWWGTSGKVPGPEPQTLPGGAVYNLNGLYNTKMSDPH